jgi:hypothetical protein
MKRLIVLIVAIIAFISVPGVDADEYLFGKWRCESPEALKDLITELLHFLMVK